MGPASMRFIFVSLAMMELLKWRVRDILWSLAVSGTVYLSSGRKIRLLVLSMMEEVMNDLFEEVLEFSYNKGKEI